MRERRERVILLLARRLWPKEVRKGSEGLELDHRHGGKWVRITQTNKINRAPQKPGPASNACAHKPPSPPFTPRQPLWMTRIPGVKAIKIFNKCSPNSKMREPNPSQQQPQGHEGEGSHKTTQSQSWGHPWHSKTPWPNAALSHNPMAAQTLFHIRKAANFHFAACSGGDSSFGDKQHNP